MLSQVQEPNLQNEALSRPVYNEEPREELKLDKVSQAIETSAKEVERYLQIVASSSDDGSAIYKRINTTALAMLFHTLAHYHGIGKEILSRVNHDNLKQNQVAGAKIDAAVDTLFGVNIPQIKSTIEEVLDLHSHGQQRDPADSLQEAIATLLDIANDPNFNQNIFRETNAIRSAGAQLKEEKKIDEPNIHDYIDRNKLLGKFQHFFHNAPPWFQLMQDHFTMALNYIGIAFNTLAVIATNTGFLGKQVSEWIDKKSEWYSRYIIPFSFAWNGLEAIAGNRAVEALVRLVPAVSFWALPFYNFTTATGVSSGVNYMLELVGKRFEKEGRAMPIDSLSNNLKHAGKILMDIFKDFITGAKTDTETWGDKLTSVLLLGGSLGGFVFAPKDRDTWLARVFGNMRNIGGFIGDYNLVTNPKFNVHKKVVGLSCGIASVLNTIMRWVDPKLARTLNHIAIAADDFGLTYWAQDSRRENKAKQASNTKMSA